MTQVVNTISAYRSLLQEQDNQIKHVAVKQLYANISLHWTDIANDITLIQQLMSDSSFPDLQLVAVLLSKLYFYLNDYDQALNYALKAGSYFNITTNDEFTEILVNQCIKKYIEACRSKSENIIQYKAIVDKMIQFSIEKSDTKLVMGVALQTLDLHLLQKVIKSMDFHDVVETLLPHLFGLDVQFRNNLLNQLSSSIPAKIIATPSQYINLLNLLYIKGDYEVVAKIIYQCLKRGQKQIAYTLSLQTSEMYGFNRKVLAAIPIEVEFQNQRKSLQYILQGKFTDDIHNVVLKNQARTDPHYLTLLKKIQSKNSIAHGSAIMALSMLQAFTQDDSFLQIKQNLQWAAKSTHWNKFSSIASLGLIFRNNKNKDIFKKFLPESTSADVVNHFPNGGALYGLGLLFTGTMNQQIIDYIISITQNPTHNQNEVIIHGACLGLGLTSFASGNQVIGERLKDILNSSTSVMGEASALALGLTYAGTNNQNILSQMIAIAQDTQHQKISRSLCLSIALICFQSPSLDFLTNLEGNPAVKLSLPLYMSCAYFNSSNSVIVKKLLKLSNDINNDVKRSSIIALGFVMYHDEKLYNLIKMLLYSYNPYIRYGCIMALAIGAKDSKEAIDLIWPLLTDSVDFVRQAACIGLAMIFQVSTNQSEPKVTDFRKSLEEILGKSHGQIMAKMGAIISIGLLDIGGRNMSVSLTTRSGLPRIEAIIGMLVFTQYWSWFPYLNFIGLAISPSMFIGVTSQLKIPKSYQLKSNCKPSMFDYPANIIKQQKKQDNKKDVAKQLSTTTKAKVRALKKKQSDMDIEMPIVKKPSLISNLKSETHPKQKQKQEQKKLETEKQQKKEEENFQILNNPTRVTEKQKKHIQFLEGRYTPVLSNRKIGISFLIDSQPGVADDFLTLKEEKMEIEKPLDQVNEAKQRQEQQSPNKDKEDAPLQPQQQFEYDQDQQLLKKKQ